MINLSLRIGEIMNKKGFTLAELLAVIALLALVMMLVVPGVSSLKRNNDRKQYQTYGDMMVQYTKTIPLYKQKDFACLTDLNMQPINNKITCNGYVLITNNGNTLTPYLSCTNSNGEETYKTTGYSLPSGC